MRMCPHRIGEEIEFNDSTDPNTLWASTTWTQITDGRVTLASSNDHALGSTGGAETITLTTEQIPSHNHSLVAYGRVFSGSEGGTFIGGTNPAFGSNQNGSGTYVVGNSGGGQAHNNMQPWRAVNRWRRVA